MIQGFRQQRNFLMEIDWLLIEFFASFGPSELLAHNALETLSKFCSIYSINQQNVGLYQTKFSFIFFIYSHRNPLLPSMSQIRQRQQSYCLSIIIYFDFICSRILVSNNPKNSTKIDIRCKFNPFNGANGFYSFKFFLELQ